MLMRSHHWLGSYTCPATYDNRKIAANINNYSTTLKRQDSFHSLCLYISVHYSHYPRVIIMKVSVSIDAVPHEFVEALDTLNIARKRIKTFLSRYDIEQFVEKAVSTDASALHYLVDDSSIGSTQVKAISQHLVERIEQKTLLVQLAPGGSGAPNAPSRPAIPGSNRVEGISGLYGPKMKQFIAANRDNQVKYGGIRQDFLENSSTRNSGNVLQQERQARQTNPQTDYVRPDQEVATYYKITIEVAGRNPCGKQQVEISALAKGAGAPPGEQAQTKRAAHHTRDKHRSVIEYRKIPNMPRDITLTIPIKGHGPYIKLALSSGASPSNISTEKKEWDNVLIPIKPLAYVSKNKTQQEADILKPGWLYVFWRGKLWRELEVQKNQALRDVNVEYYRQTANNVFNDTEERAAEGHWLSAVWIPYKLNGEYQTGTNESRIAFSSTQWDWAYISLLETDAAKLQSLSTPLDLSCYSSDQHFNNTTGDMGNIENALFNQNIDAAETGYEVVSARGKQLRSMRDSRVPVAFVPTATDKLMVCLKDKRGKVLRDKSIALDVGSRTITVTTDRNGMVEVPLKEEDSLDGNINVVQNNGVSHQANIQLTQESLAEVSTVKGQQSRLNGQGFNAGIIDGINGRKTETATKRFQKQHGLDVDGICGPKTQQQLKLTSQK